MQGPAVTSPPAAASEGPWWKDGRVWLLVAITLLSLFVGWQWKSECHDKPWDGYQWRKMCYSDVQALYATRGAADGTWPYTETFNEYPPLTGLYMHLMGEWTKGGPVPEARNAYLAASGAGFALLAVAITVCLAELVGRDRQVLYWAMAPALVVYAFYNWDLLALAPAVGALLAFRRGHYAVAGALLGIGASAKLFPAFLAPALGMWILREERGLRRKGLAFGSSFAAAWAAIHAPFLLLDAHGTIRAYTFQAGRSPNFETVWYAVGHLGRMYHSHFLDTFDDKPVYSLGSLLPFVAALACSGWAAFTRRLDPVAAAVIPVFAFLAFNKVYSVQYSLWAIPLLVVVPMPRSLKALVVVADLAVFVTLSNYFALSSTVDGGTLFTPAALATVLRAGVWAACAAWLVRQAFVTPSAPAPVRPTTEAGA